MAQVFTFPIHAEGILILEPDGLNDNLYDEDVLNEVVHFWHTLFASYVSSGLQVLRYTLAGMLSEAFCLHVQNVMASAVEAFKLILEVKNELLVG
jgi:hypothetical protein